MSLVYVWPLYRINLGHLTLIYIVSTRISTSDPCLLEPVGVGQVLDGPDVGRAQDLVHLKVGALPVVDGGRVHRHAHDVPVAVVQKHSNWLGKINGVSLMIKDAAISSI